MRAEAGSCDAVINAATGCDDGAGAPRVRRPPQGWRPLIVAQREHGGRKTLIEVILGPFEGLPHTLKAKDAWHRARAGKNRHNGVVKMGAKAI